MGTKERQILDDLAVSYKVQALAPSLATILTDGTALYALGSIYEIMTGKDLPFLINPMEAEAFWKGLREMAPPEERAERASSVVGGLTNILDFIAATILHPTQFGMWQGPGNNG